MFVSLPGLDAWLWMRQDEFEDVMETARKSDQ